MQFFLLAHEKARSVQSDNKRKALYQDRLRKKAEEKMECLSKTWIDDSTKQLYSRTYYFHRRKSDVDADNLSKPALDALSGTVFKDDRQVIWRVAAKIDLNEEFIISKALPSEEFQELLISINDENVYGKIEIQRMAS